MSARGEATIVHDEKEYGLLFTNRALATAEKQMGKGIIGVADGFSNGQTGIAEIAVLLQVGMEAHRRDNRLGGRTVTSLDAFNLLDEVGFTTVATKVMTAVAEVLGYESKEESEEDPN